jgi:TonB family protein
MRCGAWRALGGAYLFAATATVPAVAAEPVVKPRLLESVTASYPVGQHGDVEVELVVVIGEDGRVSEVELRNGAAPFAEAARSAVTKWTFSPAMRDNVPVKSRVSLKLSFKDPKPKPEPGDPPSLSSPRPALEPPPSAQAPNAAASPADVQITVEGAHTDDLAAIHIPRSDTRLIPGAFADPFRVVEILPGVAPVLSGLPYFFVRGAPPGDVGYFIDGIRVPLLFHVGAGPSVIAPALVDSVELVPSAYPARFRRFAGGIMAGETTAPSSEPRAEAQARVFDAGALVERPFAGGRGSALVAGRYSYTQAILAAVAPD